MAKKRSGPGRGGKGAGRGPTKYTRQRTDTEICPACDHSWSFHGPDGCTAISSGKPCGCHGPED